MKIFIQREVLGRFESEFNDEKKGLVKTKKVQIMEKLENGKHVLSEIKLDEKQDISKLVAGVKITIPIAYSAMVQGKKRVVYFRQDGDLKIQG